MNKKMVNLNNKKAVGDYPIFKIIGLILVILALVALFVLLYRTGIIQKITDLPGFESEELTETIDLTVCPVPIARILSDNSIHLCTSPKCEDNPKNDQGLFLDNTNLKIKYSDRWFNSPKIKIGTFVGKIVIDEKIIKGIGEDYFDAQPILEFGGVNLDKLLDLNGAYLVGKTYLCRDKHVDTNNYFRDVKEIDIYLNKFYYSLSDVLINRKVSKTSIFTNSDLTIPYENYYINLDSEFVYVDDNGKEIVKESLLKKQYDLPLDFSFDNPKDYGINSEGLVVLAKELKSDDKRQYVQFIYEGYLGTKSVSPWVLIDYFKEYGNIGRIQEKSWACLNNNCNYQN